MSGRGAGGQRCQLILQRCLAIQLTKPGNAPDDFWMYESGYLLFQGAPIHKAFSVDNGTAPFMYESNSHLASFYYVKWFGKIEELKVGLFVSKAS